MNKRKAKRKDINFLLANRHYQRLHLLVYLLSVAAIVMVYFMTIMLFSSSFNMLFTAIFSLGVGIFLVFRRDELVRTISERLEDKKRKKRVQDNKSGLQHTLKRITPKRDIKLSIGGKASIKDRVSKLKPNFSKKNNKKIKKDYIEIE